MCGCHVKFSVTWHAHSQWSDRCDYFFLVLINELIKEGSLANYGKGARKDPNK